MKKFKLQNEFWKGVQSRFSIFALVFLTSWLLSFTAKAQVFCIGSALAGNITGYTNSFQPMPSVAAGQAYYWTTTLTAGVPYTWSNCVAEGGTNSDTYMRIYDASNVVVATADDICGVNPTLTYTPAVSGLYYVHLAQYSCGTLSNSQVLAYKAVLPPTVVSFTPASGCPGTTVVITGTNFTGASAVTFGGTNAQSFIVNSPTQITAITGAGTTGTISVVNGGTGTSVGIYTVNASPAAPTPVTATPATICQGSSSNLNAVSAGNTINWFTVPTGGISVGTSASGANFPVTPAATTTYYAEATPVGPGGSQTFNYAGAAVQNFTVPAGVTTVTMDVRGAQGGTYAGATGGLGARMVGDVTVTPGQVLSVWVGQQGIASQNAGGGGGASGVTNGATALVIAGAGGGGCSVSLEVGKPGLTTTTGGNSSGAGGAAGNGGQKGYMPGDCGWAGGGGGFLGDGYGGPAGSDGGALPGTLGGPAGGKSRPNGGAGGIGGCCGFSALGSGGWGCGGGGRAEYGGGGGGGYSGGGGGQYTAPAGSKGGGGGGSFNSGVNQSNTQGFQSGNGQVILTWSAPAGCPSATRTPVTVTVNPIAAAPSPVTATPATICAGATSQLNSTGAVGSTQTWYTQLAGGVAIGTSISGVDFPVTPAVTTTYYVETFNNVPAGSQTFNFTGAAQTFTVPAGVTSITINAFGAQGVGGGGFIPGNGGRAQGVMAVAPGQVLNVYVGGTNAFNGGGIGLGGSNGGGASDVRAGGVALANRVIVAGGGGGAGGDNWGCNVGTGHGGGGIAVGANFVGGAGGAGYTSGTGCGTDGGNAGGNGGSGTHGGGGGGGGFISGGAGANASGFPAVSGTLGQGGASYNAPGCGTTGGGGGGYYGGGGAAGNNCGAGRGGGGSSWTGTLTSPVFQSGVQTGNGQVVISWAASTTCASTPRVPVTVTVNPLSPTPTPVTATPASLCPGSTSQLNSTGTPGSTQSWYTVPTGGVAIGTSLSGVDFPVTPAVTTTYYAENPAGVGAPGSQTFNFTGAAQTFTVPAGVTSVTINAFGAQGVGGGGFIPGNGGRAQGVMSVTPGQVLNVYVGGTNAFNGGGLGLGGSNGGGASDVRSGGAALANRVIVAGGGGGAGGDNWNCNVGTGHGGGGIAVGANFVGGAGGAGYSPGTGCGTDGGNAGGNGGTGFHGGGGGGGGFISGGAGANANGLPAVSGTLGQGGASYNAPGCGTTGGGGGGYYGGGGAAGTNCGAGRGGGGSSWTGTLTSPVFQSGVQSGNGQVIITWAGVATCPSVRVPVTVTVNPLSPTPNPVTATPAAICPGGTSQLNSTAAVGNIQSWYTVPNGGVAIGTSLSGADFPVTPAVTTTYYAENSVGGPGGTQTFNYTGSLQNFTVPAGITTLTIEAWGAKGSNSACVGTGGGTGSNGGYAKGDFTVTPGQVLNIYVGSQAGYNGGGLADCCPAAGCQGGNGGGASDVRIGGVSLADRKIVAGAGGGGGGGDVSYTGGNGGNGGGLVAAAGTNSSGCGPQNGGGGGGGTQLAGGAEGCGGQAPSCFYNGFPGALGAGGNGNSSDWRGGGGGGGGYYGGGGGGSYCANGGGGGGSSYVDPSAANVVHTPGVRVGDGQVTITWSGAASCPSVRVPVTVTVNPNPTVTASASPAVICAGGSSTLTGGGAATYAWNPGALVGNPSVSPVATTNYTVTGTDGNGCTGTSTVDVVVNPTPTVTASASPAVICAGGSSTLTGGGAATYAWDPGALVGNPSVSPVATTNYTVTGTDANGCTGTSTVDVVVNTLPTVTASPVTQTVCENGMATISGGGAATYTWTGGITDATPFMVVAASNYTVTGTDANGCSNTATAEVLMNAAPVITAGATPNTTCDQTTVTPSASGAGTIVWSGGLTNNVPFVAVATTTYTVTGTDGLGCSASTTVLVTVNPMSGILAPATSNQAQDHGDDFDINYYAANCDLIATVDDGAGGNVLGLTTSTVNVDATAGFHNGQPFVRRWYQITPTNNGSADVVLYINQSDFDDYNAAVALPYLPLPTSGNNADPNIGNIRITKNADAGLGNSPVVITPTANWNGTYWELSFNTPSFSQFRVHSVNPGNVPLPATVTSFSGLKLESSDKLSWTTSSEQNNAYFTLQHSTDGTNFTTIAKVNSKVQNGNSATELNYSSIHATPSLGHNYYRLQQTDLDNKLSVHAQIVDLIWGTNGSTVSIYPNPTRDILNIDLYAATAQNTTVKLLDMSGRVIKQIQAKSAVGMNNIKLSMGEIASGVYTVQVYENNQLSHTSKVKKND